MSKAHKTHRGRGTKSSVKIRDRGHWLRREIRGVQRYLAQLQSDLYNWTPAWRDGQKRHYKKRLRELRRELAEFEKARKS